MSTAVRLDVDGSYGIPVDRARERVGGGHLLLITLG